MQKLQTVIRKCGWVGLGWGAGRRGCIAPIVLWYSCTFICALFVDTLYKCNSSKTHFSSVQFKMVSMRSEKPI